MVPAADSPYLTDASGYRGSAERDVMDVIAEVRRDYAIDPDRIYLMGHSMGGYGTWSVAMAHPDVFAAIGPISGGGDASGMVKIAHIPECLASTTFTHQRQLFLPINDNYNLDELLMA